LFCFVLGGEQLFQSQLELELHQICENTFEENITLM